MKKSIAILLILVLATVGLFAAVDNDKKDATIKINALVNDYSAFGVSKTAVVENGFKSIALFQKSVSSSVDTKVEMLDLHSSVKVGFLSDINNTTGKVKLSITIADLVSDNGKIAMLVSPTEATIAPSASSKFGTLQNTLIQVKEKETGAAALAPAGTYTTTITISLISG